MRTIFRSAKPLLLGAAVTLAAFAGCSDDDSGTNNPGLNAGCPDDLEFFQANVYEPLLDKYCFLCHREGGLAGNSRLKLVPKDEAGALQKNFDMVKALAAEEVNGTSIMVLRPSGKHPNGHPGGVIFQPGSPDYSTLSLFVTRVTRGQGCAAPVETCTSVEPGPRVLRRLSREEYDATIKDLFGIESHWGHAFVPDIVIGGFDNNANALRVSPLLADQIARAAEEIATEVMKNPASVLPCDPVAEGPVPCATKLIETVGKRAFRRPLATTDVDRYLALFQKISATEGFNEGIEATIAAMLQSPHFLYRAELGDPNLAASPSRIRLTPYEIATELSYMLWGTMPDAELMAAADQGNLETEAQIEAQAKRLLQDPRSDAIIERFVLGWLELDRLDASPKDAATYPEWNEQLRNSLRTETLTFVKHVIRNGNGTLPELLDAAYTFANTEVAAHYGIPAPAVPPGEFGLVDLTGTNRAGILTHGSILATHGKPAGSSPVHRGKVIRERLLCQPLPPPPPGIVAQPPPIDPTKSTRERYAAHTTESLCRSCHELADPIGFAYEHFDGIGRYRADENGLPIDDTGEILSTSSTNTKFEGAPALATILANSPDVQGCYARQWIRYGYGLLDEGPLSCLSNSVANDFQSGNLKVLDLLVALTKTPHFLERRADPIDPGSVDPTGGAGGMGTGGAGSGGEAGAGGDPGSMSPVAFSTNVDNDWGTGYQLSVQVTNISSEKITWTVSFKVDGKIDNLWNATSTVSGDVTTFKGMDYNGTLEPGQSTSFGFVATR
ncbi:MAG: DUF1592 domain-containing protein [Polyangiaceae bacterium]|nr:DUF1592 domain-containing protein [Polyangiaceae bacterium]